MNLFVAVLKLKLAKANAQVLDSKDAVKEPQMPNFFIRGHQFVSRLLQKLKNPSEKQSSETKKPGKLRQLQLWIKAMVEWPKFSHFFLVRTCKIDLTLAIQ